MNLQDLMLDQRVKTILNENGLDFSIEKLPLVAELVTNDGFNDETSHIKTDYYGLMNSKTGEVIHTVKKGYQVSQNDEIVKLALQGAEQFPELDVARGGSINGGRRTFLQLKISGKTWIGNDEIERYLTIIDSNNGSAALSVGIGNVTMSCMNQFWSFHKSAQMKFKHSYSLEEKIAELPQLIENALSREMRLVEIYKTFESTEVSRELAHGLVKELTGINKIILTDGSIEQGLIVEPTTHRLNKMNKVYDNITKEMNQKGNNLWGLFSGITSWTSHDIQVPKRDNGW
jgi:hypothetical protein